MESTSVSARKDAIIVIGPHRSGASAIARVLALAGACQSTTVAEPEADDRLGHWESLEVRALDYEIFSDVKSGWNDLFGPRQRAAEGPSI